MWNSYDTRVCVCVFSPCVSAYIYVFSHQRAFPFFFFYTYMWNLASALNGKGSLHHLTCLYISSDAACSNKRGVVFSKKQDMFVSFSEDRDVLITPHASLTLVMWRWRNRVNECGEWVHDEASPREMSPVCTVCIWSIASCTDKHIQRQANRETFLDVRDLPRPH